MGGWKWGSDNPQACLEANSPEERVVVQRNGLACGTPVEFPEGTDYGGVGFVGKAPAYVQIGCKLFFVFVFFFRGGRVRRVVPLTTGDEEL
ncbi:unnamed protein product [Ectocarpus sp. 6 AP-2014]